MAGIPASIIRQRNQEDRIKQVSGEDWKKLNDAFDCYELTGCVTPLKLLCDKYNLDVYFTIRWFIRHS